MYYLGLTHCFSSSLFFSDHRFNDFPGFDHIEWDKKRKHVEYANELKEKKGIDMKIISVYCGLFLESSLRVRMLG